jgi:ribosomal protein S18 acetylase RimI-like enzyme
VAGVPADGIERIGADRLELVRPGWLELCDHHAALLPQLGPLRPLPERWERRRAALEASLAHPASGVWVAWRDGAVVGFATARAQRAGSVRATSDPYGDLQTLCVLPSARGRGAGTALIHAAEAHLRAHGALDVTVTVASANAGARRLYGRAGYRPFVSRWWARPVPAPAEPALAVAEPAPQDVDALEPLHTALMAHHAAVGPPYLPPQNPPDVAWAGIRASVARPEALNLVGGGGWVMVTPADGYDAWDPGPIGHVDALVVGADGRAAGTGTALFAAALARLRAEGAAAVELDVIDGNDRAAAFYARHGLARTFETLIMRLG